MGGRPCFQQAAQKNPVHNSCKIHEHRVTHARTPCRQAMASVFDCVVDLFVSVVSFEDETTNSNDDNNDWGDVEYGAMPYADVGHICGVEPTDEPMRERHTAWRNAAAHHW